MIIGVCGRVAAGKETLTQFLRDKGFVYIETSKIIIDELKRAGIEVTREHMQDWADALRKKYGVGALMIAMLDKTRQDTSKNYIFDSLRNLGEAEFLRKERNDFILIGVDAPKEIRFKRMLKRAKESDPKTWEEFLKMDERDNFDVKDPMGQQTGKLLENSDYVIVNDGDLNNSLGQVEEVWRAISRAHSISASEVASREIEDKI